MKAPTGSPVGAFVVPWLQFWLQLPRTMLLPNDSMANTSHPEAGTGHLQHPAGAGVVTRSRLGVLSPVE
ncbi:hypothetical protein SSPIM334S_03071 [Streptomyces spiroverticillatus]